jgi:hypothetical protein
MLDIRSSPTESGSLLAMWERHAVLFTPRVDSDGRDPRDAGPARTSTVPPDWADRAYRVVNEWNHTPPLLQGLRRRPHRARPAADLRRAAGPADSGRHDALLVEMLDCGAAVATSFVDWLHDEGPAVTGSLARGRRGGASDGAGAIADPAIAGANGC